MLAQDLITKPSVQGRTMSAFCATVAEKALIVLPGTEGFVIKSCANIPGVETTLYSTINVYEVLKAEKVIMTKAAVEKLEEVYA